MGLMGQMLGWFFFQGILNIEYLLWILKFVDWQPVLGTYAASVDKVWTPQIVASYQG